jgi:hypothetical protein
VIEGFAQFKDVTSNAGVMSRKQPAVNPYANRRIEAGRLCGLIADLSTVANSLLGSY